MPKLLPDQSFYPSPTMAMQAPAETLAYVEKDGGPQHLIASGGDRDADTDAVG